MRLASGEWKRKLNAAASDGAPITFESLVDDYLSEAHRDHLGTGCPVSALSADIARSDKRTRALVTTGSKAIIGFLANAIRESSEARRREGSKIASNHDLLCPRGRHRHGSRRVPGLNRTEEPMMPCSCGS